MVVFDNDGPLRSMVPDDLPVNDLKTISLRRSLLPLIATIRRLRPSLIYSTLGYVNLALLVARPLLPRCSKVWVREANLPSISLPNNPNSLLMWQGYRWLYRHADRVLVTSERMKGEFVHTFKVPVAILSIFPNPIDETEVRARATIELTRVSGPGLRFVAVGRLTYQKGFDRLLRWFADFNRVDAHLTILGDGELSGELKQLVSELGVAKQVSFAGFTENLWGCIAGADAFLMSSRWEGMPNSALESLACGTPVIATAESGGIAEVADQVRSIDLNGVTVTRDEKEFLLAMNAITPVRSSGLRPSLLPRRYRLESVVRTFDEWTREQL